MKNMILILSMFFLFTGCEKKTKLQETSIYGTWQLIERFDGGSPKPIQAVQSGKTINFSRQTCSKQSRNFCCRRV